MSNFEENIKEFERLADQQEVVVVPPYKYEEELNFLDRCLYNITEDTNINYYIVKSLAHENIVCVTLEGNTVGLVYMLKDIPKLSDWGIHEAYKSLIVTFPSK